MLIKFSPLKQDASPQNSLMLCINFFLQKFINGGPLHAPGVNESIGTSDQREQQTDNTSI